MKKIATILLLICINAFAQQGSFTDSRDGKTYKTVKIGYQTWMAENLNYNAVGSKCYDNKPDNCIKYGRLYNWKTSLNACPKGWHLPSKDEWDSLLSYVENINGCMYCDIKHLKTVSGWKNISGWNSNGTDTYGFSALPGGCGFSNGGFNFIGENGHWWSTSEYDSNEVYILKMDYNNMNAGWNIFSKGLFLINVRCVKDLTIAEKKVEIAKAEAEVAKAKAKAEAEVAKAKAKTEAEAKAEAAKADSIATVADKARSEIAKKGSFTDARDGKIYKIVSIGNQIWMAENLNYNASGSKCYKNDPSNCNKYGRLYDWETAMKACPKGWHLPSNADWNVLMKFANPSCSDNSSCAGAGTKLKAASGWNNNGNGTDDYGFSALPGGYYGGLGGGFSNVGYRGLWWSSSESSSLGAYYRRMDYNFESAYYGSSDKSDLFSVRCVQD